MNARLRAPELLVALLLAAGVVLVLCDHEAEGSAALGAVVGYVGGQRAGVLRERRRAAPRNPTP